MGGFIPRILEDAVEYCCSDCLLPNGKSASDINFEIDGKGNLAQKSSIDALISSIDSQTDFSAPVNVHRGQTRYSLYPHVELAESPGVAFIAVTDRRVMEVAVENLFFEIWPMLLLTSIMMLAVGMIMWIMVCPVTKSAQSLLFLSTLAELNLSKMFFRNATSEMHVL